MSVCLNLTAWSRSHIVSGLAEKRVGSVKNASTTAAITCQ